MEGKHSHLPKKTCQQKKSLAGRTETTCLSVNDINLNDINSRVKSNIAAAYRLETAQKKQNMDKLEDFVLRERLVDE